MISLGISWEGGSHKRKAQEKGTHEREGKEGEEGEQRTRRERKRGITHKRGEGRGKGGERRQDGRVLSF